MWFFLPIGLLVFLALYEVYKHLSSYHDEHVGRWESRDSLVERWDALLSEHNPFYRNLTHSSKLRFTGRIKALTM